MPGTRRLRRSRADNRYTDVAGDRAHASTHRWAERHFGVLVGTYPGQWIFGLIGATSAAAIALYAAARSLWG
ncbi:MAG TPA: hypothetical protein VFP10_02130 [Candidatus Eisenbacteria bacterium]|nr:hypothetical protein [Candidatus Eisenbacteria bacterium]